MGAWSLKGSSEAQPPASATKAPQVPRGSSFSRTLVANQDVARWKTVSTGCRGHWKSDASSRRWLRWISATGSIGSTSPSPAPPGCALTTTPSCGQEGLDQQWITSGLHQCLNGRIESHWKQKRLFDHRNAEGKGVMHDFLIGVGLLKSLKLLKRIIGSLRAWERKRFNCAITKCFSATSSLIPGGLDCTMLTLEQCQSLFECVQSKIQIGVHQTPEPL